MDISNDNKFSRNNDFLGRERGEQMLPFISRGYNYEFMKKVKKLK